MTPQKQLRRMARRKRRWMRRNKWRRQLTAYRNGLFWMPCPLCGEDFGGRESPVHITVPTGEQSSQVVCPACELDLGAKAAGFCAESGHSWGTRYNGRPVAVSRDDSRVEMQISLRVSGPPDEIYCVTCGIDESDAE